MEFIHYLEPIVVLNGAPSQPTVEITWTILSMETGLQLDPQEDPDGDGQHNFEMDRSESKYLEPRGSTIYLTANHKALGRVVQLVPMDNIPLRVKIPSKSMETVQPK